MPWHRTNIRKAIFQYTLTIAIHSLTANLIRYRTETTSITTALYHKVTIIHFIGSAPIQHTCTLRFIPRKAQQTHRQWNTQCIRTMRIKIREATYRETYGPYRRRRIVARRNLIARYRYRSMTRCIQIAIVYFRNRNVRNVGRRCTRW